MTLVHLIDVLTALASLSVKVVGFPTQIREGHRALLARRRAGITWQAAAAMCVSYAVWVVHGLAVHDLVEVWGQGFGVLTTAVMLAQAAVCARRASEPAADAPDRAQAPGEVGYP